MNITLYYHPLSSFCHKVLIALYEHGIDFEKRIINLGDEADRAELRAIWPMMKFPVIRDHAHDRNVPESSIIIEYLDRDAARLIPQDRDDALDVRLWDRYFDNYVQRLIQQIVSNRISGANADMSGARAALDTAYHMIDSRLAARTWAAGEGFSMADCAAAPALFYASTLQQFPAECAHLAAYFERLVARPSVKRVIDEAKPYFDLYPFADSIPARFRDAA